MSWGCRMGASRIGAGSGSCSRKGAGRARPSTPPWPSSAAAGHRGPAHARDLRDERGQYAGRGSSAQRAGLSYIPEAHCYLRCQGERIDMTGVPAGATPIERFLTRSPSPSSRSARPERPPPEVSPRLDRPHGDGGRAHPRRRVADSRGVYRRPRRGSLLNARSLTSPAVVRPDGSQ